MDYEELLWSLKIANYIFLFFALLFSIHFVRIVNSARALHGNLRFLLILVSIEFRILGVSRAIAEIVDFFAHDSLISKINCSFMSILNAGAIGSIQLSFLSILVERFVATYYHSNYENWSNKLARIFIVFELLYGLLFGLKVYQLDIQSNNQTYTQTCVSLTRQPILLVYSWVVFGSLVSLAIGPMLWIYRYNRRLSKIPGTGNLSTRFQYNDNYLVLRILMPLFAFGVFGVGSFCSSIMLYVYLQLRAGSIINIWLMILIRITFFLTDICSLIFEIQFLRIHPILRCWAKKKTWKLFRSSSLQINIYPQRHIEVANEGNTYFKQFAVAWQ